jgi:hypothetical protein
LCENCNYALGHVGDNIDILKKMIVYLEQYQEPAVRRRRIVNVS